MPVTIASHARNWLTVHAAKSPGPVDRTSETCCLRSVAVHDGAQRKAI